MTKTRFHGSDVKYSVPTHFNKDVHGAIWIFQEEKGIQIYIQTSPDSEAPSWKRMGEVLEKAFEHLYIDQKFIEMCLRLYKNKDDISELDKLINL